MLNALPNKQHSEVVLVMQVDADYGRVMLNTYRVVVGDGGVVSTGSWIQRGTLG